MDKAKIKQELIRLEKLTIDESMKNHEEFLTGNLLNRDDVLDADDQSHHIESVEKAENMDHQVHLHEEHLKELSDISFESTDVVKLGAIVSVNGRCMIVAIAKPKFSFDGRDFIGISTKAPIYRELKGKRAGDQFIFNERKFKIESVD